MKYKTLFRVLVKVVGVWLVAQGIASFVGGAASILATLISRPAGMSFPLYAFLLTPAQALALTGVGAYLFFGGGWIADLAIPGNRVYCHECGYELTAASANICPECGTVFRPGGD